MKLKNRSGSMPLKRIERMLVSVASRSLRLRSSRRLTSCWPWPGGVGDHQPAAVQHADELLQLFGANRLRRELALEALGDFVEARLAVEHLQDGELLFLEAEVLQADGVLHDPVEPPLVAMLPGAQIGPLADRQLPRGAGDQASARVAMLRRVGDGESGRGGVMPAELCPTASRSPYLPLSHSCPHSARACCSGAAGAQVNRHRCRQAVAEIQLPCSWRLATSARTLYMPSDRTSELTLVIRPRTVSLRPRAI